ncbi:MAG: glycoside hydrolase family 13 protein, partial [Bacteroidota bacterium]
MTFRTLLSLACLLAGVTAFAQSPDSPLFDDDPMQHLPVGMEYSQYKIRQPEGLPLVKQRVEPLHWWTNMANPRLEVMIYDRNVAQYEAATVDYPGVKVEYVKRQANPNYLFVGLYVSPSAKPGSFDIRLAPAAAPDKSSSQTVKQSGNTKTIAYALKAHPRKARAGREPLSAKDLIYLVMPDRFANGDPSNDRVYSTNDTIVARQKLLFRHGGDLQGVITKLDYLQELGVTALWLNPVLENDQPYASYHGYAVTDHYRIDPRFGTNELYRELVEKAHAKGIKIIMDVIFNHVGDEHWQMRDLPSYDWIHQWPKYTQTTYRAPTIFDPNGSEYDRKLMTDGWFDKHMPDLNQQNEHLATYLIQNSIWWALYSGQDGYRIDTYAYPDTKFMAQWNKRLLEEVPDLGIFGETWVHGPGVQSWFVGGGHLNQTTNTHLPGVTDYQLYYAIHEAMSQEPGWTDGVNRIYYTLAQDHLYPDPSKNVTFLDNHDLARIYTVFGQDMTKTKSSLAMLLTMRGIPMLYYGTELGFTGAGGAFGEGGRVDFPGGFAGDARDLFSAADRNATEADLFNYVKRLANFRKDSPALTTGKLTHFVPVDGVYVYFRQADDQTVMCVFNGNSGNKPLKIDARLSEILAGATKGYDLTRDVKLAELKSLELAGKETRVIV